MNRLIIETSSPQASVAFFKDGQLFQEEIFASGRGCPTILFSVLERFFRCGDCVDEIVVGVGPGSYSGIRIGISAVIGLTLAGNLPGFGIVSSLGYPEPDYQVVLNAHGGWTYLAVAQRRLVGVPINLSHDELLRKIDPGLRTYGGNVPGVVTISTFPLASILGERLVASPPLTRLPLVPLYLKAPHITVAKAGSVIGL